MARNFTLNLEGGAEVLQELAADAIADLAREIAAAAGEGAEVEMSTSDRARAVVKVPADRQAKDGALSRAAAQFGLEVRPPKNGKRRK